MMGVPKDCLDRLRERMSREELAPNRTKEGRVMVDLEDFFLEELQAVKPITREEVPAFFLLQDRGLFNVQVSKEKQNSESFTVLTAIQPGDRFIQDGQSPHRIGYDYYVQRDKHKELAKEFRKHLPSLRFLFVQASPPSTDSSTDCIKAYFADGSFPEAFKTLAARFLAAFFRILEEKSLTRPKEVDTCMEFIIDQLKRISYATAQECRRFIHRIYTADFMPGSSHGKPENPHDPLQEAPRRGIPARTPTTDSSREEKEMPAKGNQNTIETASNESESESEFSFYDEVELRAPGVSNPRLDSTQIQSDLTSAEDFFWKELKAAKKSRYRDTKGMIFNLKERGLVDVTKGLRVYDGKWYTALQILEPRALLSQEALIPFRLGYEYYEQFEKRKKSNGRVENILVHQDEVEKKFRTHLTDLRHLLVRDSTQHAGRVCISRIDAFFDLEVFLRCVNGHLSRFLAAFFRILADKNSGARVENSLAVTALSERPIQ